MCLHEPVVNLRLAFIIKLDTKPVGIVYQGSEGIAQFGFEPLIQMAASQMNDRLPEAREAARKLLVYLQTEYRKNPPKTTFSDTSVSEQMEVKQNLWEEFCLNRLPATTAQAVLRVTCVDNS